MVNPQKKGVEELEFVSDYILAAAEGFREADPELSEEDSVALVSEVIDALFAGVEEEFSWEQMSHLIFHLLSFFHQH